MIVNSFSLSLLLVVFASVVPAIHGQSKDSAHVAGLLSEAKTEAVQLKFDANELKSFTRSQLSWKSHASKVTEIKEHVNKSGELLTQMMNAKSEGSPWQQQAIERIQPLLKDLADTVESTIDNLNKHPEHLMTSPYKAYAESNAALAENLVQVISDYVEYGKAKNKSEELADRLEVPGN